MSFAAFPAQNQVVALLQRSLERKRLAHAYLFTGHSLDDLEVLARTLAKTLNCLRPARRGDAAVDCCDACSNCRKMDGEGHADIHWVRPESKSRAIVLSQIRELMAQIHLKPNDAKYKVAIIVAADRMNVQSANAFLKTLEEPPPRSVIILLTTEPQQLLDTILSRCLRLNFAGDGGRNLASEWKAWLTEFGENAAAAQPGLLGRYRLLGSLLKHLGELREHIEKSLTERSPLSRHDDVEPETRRHWEEELEAAIEAEYRRQRAEVVAALHWWCRDVWLRTLGMRDVLLTFPELDGTVRLSQRLSPHEALANLSTLERTQRQLATNVQEALALEVGLLKLHL